MPNIHISTGAVYDRWRMNYFEFSLDDVLVAIKKQDYRAMNNNLFNDLLGPLQVVHPEIRRALEQLGTNKFTKLRPQRQFSWTRRNS